MNAIRKLESSQRSTGTHVEHQTHYLGWRDNSACVCALRLSCGCSTLCPGCFLCLFFSVVFRFPFRVLRLWLLVRCWGLVCALAGCAGCVCAEVGTRFRHYHRAESPLFVVCCCCMYLPEAMGDGIDEFVYKLVLLGEASVGKSSLVVRFVQDQFHNHIESTIGAAFFTKSIPVDGDDVTFEIWDTAGQERYHSLAPMYYRGAKAAIVVYDVTDPASYDRAHKWVDELKSSGGSGTVITLVGNKVCASQVCLLPFGVHERRLHCACSRSVDRPWFVFVVVTNTCCCGVVLVVARSRWWCLLD